MLINIHQSVFDNNHIWDKPETIPALENLANAVREGKHLVISDRETLKIITQCQDLSKTTRVIYNMLYNDFLQLKPYLSFVTRYIEITDLLEPTLSSLSGKEVIQVPLRFFENTESIQKTILLCENIRDTSFYRTIARVYVIWKWKNTNIKNNISLEFEPKGGGGNTINIEYDNIQKTTKRFCLCILDSDRISPEGKLGSTAALIASIDQNQNSQFFRTKVFILDVHEIENLIPNSILLEICSGNQQREEAMKRIKTLQEIRGSQIKHFLDIKEGTLMYKIFNSTNPKDKLFWESHVLEINTILKCINDDCLADWKCKTKNPKNHCKCQISLGFGEHTLDNTIEYLEKIEPHKIAKEFNNDMKPEWEKIGRVVVDFCIAHSPIRV